MQRLFVALSPSLDSSLSCALYQCECIGCISLFLAKLLWSGLVRVVCCVCCAACGVLRVVWWEVLCVVRALAPSVSPCLKHTHIHTHTYTYTHTHTHIHTYIHTHTYTHTHTCKHTRTHARTHPHKHTGAQKVRGKHTRASESKT